MTKGERKKRLPRVIHAVIFSRGAAEDTALILGYSNRRVKVEEATLTTASGLSRPVFAIAATARRERKQ